MKKPANSKVQPTKATTAQQLARLKNAKEAFKKADAALSKARTAHTAAKSELDAAVAAL